MIKLKEIISVNSYYRAVGEYHGDNIKFKPEGYYEDIDDSNSPVYFFGDHKESDIKETAASKYIGGAVLGAFSMNAEQDNGPYFIYEINETPTKDISNWSGHDFEYLQEVRYRHDVEGKYIGKIILDLKIQLIFREFYRLKSQTEDSWEDFDENKYTDLVISMEQDGKFQKMLNDIKIK